MASPVYGTGLAGYMNILGGRARGMNEAERTRRMQEQQDFTNAYQLAGMEDRIASREQERQDQYAWNAYNAALGQAREQTGYEFDVYDRVGREQQQAIQNRLAFTQLAARQAPRDSRRTLSPTQARDIAALEATAYNPSAGQAERDAAIAALQRTGDTPYQGVASVPSQSMGLLGRAGEYAKAFQPFFPWNEGFTENIAQAYSGYTPESLTSELSALRNQIAEITAHEQGLIEQGRELPVALRRQRDELMDQYENAAQASQARQTAYAYSPATIIGNIANTELGWLGSAYDYLSGAMYPPLRSANLPER